MMFRLSYSSPCAPRGTITFKKQPWSLGYHRDVKGVLWDIHGYIGCGGKPWVQACKVADLHKGLSSTASWAPAEYNQTWYPYWVEIQEESEYPKEGEI